MHTFCHTLITQLYRYIRSFNRFCKFLEVCVSHRGKRKRRTTKQSRERTCTDVISPSFRPWTSVEIVQLSLSFDIRAKPYIILISITYSKKTTTIWQLLFATLKHFSIETYYETHTPQWIIKFLVFSSVLLWSYSPRLSKVYYSVLVGGR